MRPLRTGLYTRCLPSANVTAKMGRTSARRMPRPEIPAEIPTNRQCGPLAECRWLILPQSVSSVAAHRRG